MRALHRAPAETQRQRFRRETDEQQSERAFAEGGSEGYGACEDGVQMPTEAFLAVLKLDE